MFLTLHPHLRCVLNQCQFTSGLACVIFRSLNVGQPQYIFSNGGIFSIQWVHILFVMKHENCQKNVKFKKSLYKQYATSNVNRYAMLQLGKMIFKYELLQRILESTTCLILYLITYDPFDIWHWAADSNAGNVQIRSRHNIVFRLRWY